jgi:4a-hydroxytetrahydrobiopterin dehydratase
MTPSTPLTLLNCKPIKVGSAQLLRAEIDNLLSQLLNWKLTDFDIHKTFEFQNYYQTIAFVNAVAWVSHAEDHHPSLTVSYNQCTVTYSTHSIQGLSLNDFISAAKIDALQKV